MKRALSFIVAIMLAVAFSVTAFADIDLTNIVANPLNENKLIELPSTVDVSDGATVTLNIKGTSDNTAIRFYLTDGNDVGRVTDVTVVNVLGGTFETTVELVINYNGGFGGSSAPTHLMIKGPDYATPVSNTAFEVISFVGVDAPVEEAPAEETTAEDTPAEETPAEDAPAETGLALAVIPMAVALAAVVISKRR